jgi:hypothetical protein
MISMIAKLNFLEKSTRPDIAYAVHQAAQSDQPFQQVQFSVVSSQQKCYL